MEVILAIGVIAGLSVVAYRVIRHIRKERYFASEEFLAHKQAIARYVWEHNEIARYVAEIRSRGTFAIGSSSSGAQAHLASFDNTSYHNYRRDRNVASYGSPNVHNCSLQVVRNASADPIKYVMKYFNIRAEEGVLLHAQVLGESISRLESALHNLRVREEGVARAMNPPGFILKHYLSEFMHHVGVELSPISVPYPTFTFEYVSAGGNSSQRTSLTLDTPVIDALVETLSQKIRYRKSAAGQRSLMTARLREYIKARDGYACRYCRVSVQQEPHLLLEVDHIVPVSRGGLSIVENLQTLCWRCNRSKSNKIVSA
ncbi:HNH endonuclease [Litorihabitans aurantiacus]|uniref:HNH nuclease domain-containing protein n=1 Tax=Litorihabitans aurantiacus TaxID=1930061 RepID=A0AA37XIM6_9MICO|nr:HNH endonuclease [Litorihabitans aurantiacus]GMA33185.1 hypothetical protein GCM10025875_31770 [Litorihabitans aurantiacus]